MRRLTLFAAAALTLLAPPVLAQSYTAGFNFLKGVRERDANTVQNLIDTPGSTVINTREQSSGEGALHILTRGRDYTWLAFMLARGARPDIQSRDGTTPLIIAAQIGWTEGAGQLLARRANPNLANGNGETPLIFAVRRRDLAMVRLLLAAHADPNQTDHSSGYSALDIARQDGRSAAIVRELEQARPRS
jgi:uncharacterized protein